MEREDCRGGAWRSGGAIVVLLLFRAGLARSLWPEFAPALLRIVQVAGGADAAVLQTEHMIVRNASRIDEATLHDVLARLEADYAAIKAVAGEGMGTRVSVMVADGAGPALSDGVGLSVFHDRGRIDLSTAPFFLALHGQSSDAWVVLLRGAGAYVPLAEAEGLWTAELARRGIEPQPCREALPQASPLRGYCGALLPAR